MPELERAWVRAGGIAGLATTSGYLIVLFAPLPWTFRRLIFFAIGPAGILFVLGLDRLLAMHGRTVKLQIAKLFGVIGLAVMNVMAVVQATIAARMDKHLPAAKDAAGRQMLDWVRNSVNSVHLGMDVSFDIFFLVSVVLFAISMIGHPRFGAKFAIPGCAAAIATLGLNLYAFPLPPEPDFGPLMALWLCAVAVRMLSSVNYERPARVKQAGAV